VERVVYPGLASHPDHEVAKRLLAGFGGMVSVVLKGGGPAADRFVSALRLALAAPSLGGVQTLVSQPRYTSHAGLTREQREGQGIPDGFVRISVGIENAEDLVADFEQALAAAATKAKA
jgi:cystathionine beta-lyase/cystathionine gamma-synthase